ncbi:MAG: hypothetical protein R3D68_07680 [Hyphomicrobiaceae bacterium]
MIITTPRVALAIFAGMFGALLSSSPSVRAQDATPQAKPAAVELTPEEKKEREMRKDCKVRICSAFHNRKPDGGDISCNVLKTWRKEQLTKMIQKAKVSWPWGNVRCTADIKLRRADLIKALTADKIETQLEQHHISCVVERDKGEKSDIKFDFTPKVTFEKGKATKAAIKWGKIEAPTLVKGAMWTATATDNTFNVLQGTLVEDINDFISNKCMEVKDEWQGK